MCLMNKLHNEPQATFSLLFYFCKFSFNLFTHFLLSDDYSLGQDSTVEEKGEENQRSLLLCHPGFASPPSLLGSLDCPKSLCLGIMLSLLVKYILLF